MLAGVVEALAAVGTFGPANPEARADGPPTGKRHLPAVEDAEAPRGEEVQTAQTAQAAQRKQPARRASTEGQALGPFEAIMRGTVIMRVPPVRTAGNGNGNGGGGSADATQQGRGGTFAAAEGRAGRQEGQQRCMGCSQLCDSRARSCVGGCGLLR